MRVHALLSGKTNPPSVKAGYGPEDDVDYYSNMDYTIGYFILEWTTLVCTPASTALFACPGGTDCVQVRYRHIRQAAIPARVVLGTAHMRVSSVSLPYLQNRLPSLIISAILAQYSSLCDHLVLQFNLG